MATDETVTQNPSVILDEEQIQFGGFVLGDDPSDVLDRRRRRRRKGDQDPDADSASASIAVFRGGLLTPPIHPVRALNAVLHSGTLAATCEVVAEGSAGVRYEIVPRFGDSPSMTDFQLDDPSTWPPEAIDQRKKLQVLVQAGFQGRGAQSLRAGFYEAEHDRAIVGWGGVIVLRERVIPGERPTRPRPTRAFAAFESSRSRFTRPDRRFTMVPVPIALEDGSVVWIEEPRKFRRIRTQIGRNTAQGSVFGSGTGTFTWSKEYGDWRSMDARSGKYSTGNRWVPQTEPFEPGEYRPGKLPRNSIPAPEVMHWRNHFPGAYPYGISAWHSEISAVDGAAEQTKLILEYLKSGLHSVILAAANRPFEAGTVDNAIEKIDELGRGRKGLASLITIQLVPADSDVQRSGGDLFGQNKTDDRGRMVLHELNTKLAPEITKGEMHQSLSVRIENAERIPALLLGKSDNYNFATAAAAWAVVTKLKFEPRHEQREAFLSRFLIEQDITLWMLDVISPEWEEKEPLSGVASVAGNMGGMSINRAMALLGMVMEVDIKRVDEWWGNLPFPIVQMVLGSDDPVRILEGLGITDHGFKEGAVGPAVIDAIDDIEEAAETVARRARLRVS